MYRCFILSARYCRTKHYDCFACHRTRHAVAPLGFQISRQTAPAPLVHALSGLNCNSSSDVGWHDSQSSRMGEISLRPFDAHSLSDTSCHSRCHTFQPPSLFLGDRNSCVGSICPSIGIVIALIVRQVLQHCQLEVLEESPVDRALAPPTL